MQGEGGFIPLPSEYLQGLRRRCDAAGILLVADEIQCGMGRTGRVWAIEHSGVEPDVLVSGKSLGGGLPLAAVTGRREVVDAVGPGGYGGTFGGNPVACAAALVMLDTIGDEAFAAECARIERHLRTRLEEIASRSAQVGEVRGLGPMIGVELVDDRERGNPAPELTVAVTAECARRGLILLSCGHHGNVIRFLVPLTIADEHLLRGLEIFEEALAAVSGGAEGK